LSMSLPSEIRDEVKQANNELCTAASKQEKREVSGRSSIKAKAVAVGLGGATLAVLTHGVGFLLLGKLMLSTGVGLGAGTAAKRLKDAKVNKENNEVFFAQRKVFDNADIEHTDKPALNRVDSGG